MMRRLCLSLILLVGALAVEYYMYRGRLQDRMIVGTVIGPDGGIAGARVRFQTSGDVVLTDAGARFVLPLPGKLTTITAWKEGYTIGAVRSDAVQRLITLRKLPSKDNPDYMWVNPHESYEHPSGESADGKKVPHRNDCSHCHDWISDEWRGSAHSRAFEQASRFRDMFIGLGANGKKSGWSLVDERPDGEDVCASCHNPAPARTNNIHGAASEISSGGVHCDFCHKIVGAAGEVGLTHGRYGLRFLRPSEGQVFFGPLEDGHRDQENSYSPFQTQSRLCASCHEGVVFGVRVYETYSEWQASPAGRAGVQCQKCHMKPTGLMRNLAISHGGIDRDPMTLGNHTFFDGSHRDMLKNCLRLALDVADGQAVVNIAVEGVGHRVPTGLPDRNLTLVIEAFDRDGKPLAKHEKLFAKVLKDFEGRSPAPFWRAVPEFDDNRLTPGKPERIEFALPAGTAKVTAKLVYRKFWPEVAREKGWPDDAWVVGEATK